MTAENYQRCQIISVNKKLFLNLVKYNFVFFTGNTIVMLYMTSYFTLTFCAGREDIEKLCFYERFSLL